MMARVQPASQSDRDERYILSQIDGSLHTVLRTLHPRKQITDQRRDGTTQITWPIHNILYSRHDRAAGRRSFQSVEGWKLERLQLGREP